MAAWNSMNVYLATLIVYRYPSLSRYVSGYKKALVEVERRDFFVSLQLLQFTYSSKVRLTLTYH
jgi:hypothetical protein